MSDSDKQYHLGTFGDNEVQEFHDKPVPTFLKFVYFILPIWGAIWMYLYWNGSEGFLDRGYWSELQSAANTKVHAEQVEEGAR